MKNKGDDLFMCLLLWYCVSQSMEMRLRIVNFTSLPSPIVNFISSFDIQSTLMECKEKRATASKSLNKVTKSMMTAI